MELVVDLDAVRRNARRVRDMVDGDVVAVVKGVDATPRIVRALRDAGIGAIGVSRVEHLRQLRELAVERVMVRVPSPAEIEDVVELADVTMHASPETVRRAGDLAKSRRVTHRVIPMLDAGDGREGVGPSRAATLLDTIEDTAGVHLAAIGVNRGCFGDRPDGSGVRHVAASHRRHPLSVGGSGFLPILDRLPDRVSRVRVGDAILTGRWDATPIDGLSRETVELRAEILTRRDGEALIDVGSVTTDPEGLIPHGAFELTRWSTEQGVIAGTIPDGPSVTFGVEYEALARACRAGVSIRVRGSPEAESP